MAGGSGGGRGGGESRAGVVRGGRGGSRGAKKMGLGWCSSLKEYSKYKINRGNLALHIYRSNVGATKMLPRSPVGGTLNFATRPPRGWRVCKTIKHVGSQSYTPCLSPTRTRTPQPSISEHPLPSNASRSTDKHYAIG